MNMFDIRIVNFVEEFLAIHICLLGLMEYFLIPQTKQLDIDMLHFVSHLSKIINPIAQLNNHAFNITGLKTGYWISPAIFLQVSTDSTFTVFAL